MPERPNSKVFVAGHRGLAGSAIVRRLQQDGITRSPPREASRSPQPGVMVDDWFKANRPETVYLVAGTVGGILANSTRPAEFIYDNLLIHRDGRARVLLLHGTRN